MFFRHHSPSPDCGYYHKVLQRFCKWNFGQTKSRIFPAFVFLNKDYFFSFEAFALAMATAFSKSFSEHNPTVTGFFGRRFSISRCVPSLMDSIVGLVVPINLQIWVSLSSGQFLIIHKIAFGLSPLWVGDRIFLAFAFKSICTFEVREDYAVW